MTTLQTPWTVWSNNDTPSRALIKDASGKCIGLFDDYRDAERVVAVANLGVTEEDIDDLREQIVRLEHD